LARRDVLVFAAAADAGLASTSCSRASGQTAPAAGWSRGRLDIFPDLASRVTILDADDNLAAQLGDGKETDGTTNWPVYQTNPALFAAPHSLSVDSKGDSNVVDGMSAGRRRRFKHVPV